MRRIFRWLLYLFIIVVVLVVAGILLLDTIVKNIMESRMHAATGMEVRIGKIDVGLLTPTLTIDNFRIYNTPAFGGSLFMDLPELHVEYDPQAIRAGSFHLKLVRINLAEIDLIQDKKGRLNVQDFQSKALSESKGTSSTNSSLKGLTFTGIDTLNMTLGKLRMANLATGRDEEIQFGIKNQVMHNVKSAEDLGPLNFALLSMGMRTAAATAATNSAIDVSALLKVVTGK